MLSYLLYFANLLTDDSSHKNDYAHINLQHISTSYRKVSHLLVTHISQDHIDFTFTKH